MLGFFEIGLLDVLILLWIGFAVWRGQRNGLAVEMPRLVGIAVFALTGFGLFTWTNRALTEASRVTGLATNGAGFVSLLLASWFLARHGRERIGDWARRRWGRAPGKAAVVGGVRGFLLVCVVLLVFAHWPLKWLTRPVAEASALGRLLTRHVLPVYEKTHNGSL